MSILYYCAKCGKAVEEKFGSGKFCSRSCANSRIFSEESNVKRSISNSRAWDLLGRKEKHFCKLCGCATKKTKTGLCQKCLRYSEEGKAIISATSKLSYQKVKSEGRFVGWKARNIVSFAEQFWQKVLDNNGISYKKEFTVNYGKMPNEHYFLDFLIQKNNVNIDLEIDGKQHQYEDRKKHDEIRDKRLSDCGYIVYRIKWNEVNSEKGKLEMKEKINNFLNYLNSI